MKPEFQQNIRRKVYVQAAIWLMVLRTLLSNLDISDDVSITWSVAQQNLRQVMTKCAAEHVRLLIHFVFRRFMKKNTRERC